MTSTPNLHNDLHSRWHNREGDWQHPHGLPVHLHLHVRECGRHRVAPRRSDWVFDLDASSSGQRAQWTAAKGAWAHVAGLLPHPLENALFLEHTVLYLCEFLIPYTFRKARDEGRAGHSPSHLLDSDTRSRVSYGRSESLSPGLQAGTPPVHRSIGRTFGW